MTRAAVMALVSNGRTRTISQANLIEIRDASPAALRTIHSLVYRELTQNFDPKQHARPERICIFPASRYNRTRSIG